MKILISEGSLISNVGSAALLENAVKIVNQLYPNAEIVVLCQHIESVFKFLNRKYPVFNEFFIFPRKKNFIAKCFWIIQNGVWIMTDICIGAFISKFYYTISRQKRQTLRIIKSSELIFCIGAERLNDNFYKTAYASAYMLKIMQHYNKPLIHLSMTLGPLYNKQLINVTKQVLNNSRRIFVRDQKSYDLAFKLKINPSLIINNYDIAILQESINGKEAFILSKKYNISSTRSKVGISVLKWKYQNAVGGSRYKEYIESFAYVCDFLIDKYNVQIVFIPTNLPVLGNVDDDNLVALDIIDKMKFSKDIIVIEDLLKPSEMKGLFSLFDMAIVTRMHAAILCSGTGTPIVSVNYQYKLREYMKHLNIEDYSVDIDYLNSHNLLDITESAFINKDNLRKSILEKISKMKITLENDIRNLVEVI